MNPNTNPLSRREFLTRAARTAAMLGVGGAWAAASGGAGEPTPLRGLRISYFYNGEIRVGWPGRPDERPLTTGHWDFKPSWSKTGDMLVCFRRLRDDPVVTNWLTAIFIINVDGTGFHLLSDGTHTDFNPTWTRDGTNMPVWNRKLPERGGFRVMAGKVGGKPGEEVALTDGRFSVWVHSALRDGRLLVAASPSKRGPGYFLMTPRPGGEPLLEPIECELATRGLLDRISVSPNETMVCFEFQPRSKGGSMVGRTLYVADFDARKPSITNARPFANEAGRPFWFAYPRWVGGESAVVYHSGETGRNQLYLYRLAEGSSVRISVDPRADYRYPHGEAAPC